MDNLKVFIVSQTGNEYGEYINWIDNAVRVNDIKEADLVLFAGGADVSPSFYKDAWNKKTQSDIKRDIFERFVFDEARELDKHILGICRGSQFVCVMSGGRLVQHQNNPRYIHRMKLNIDGGVDMLISSTHHQAQFPFEMPESDYKVLGYTTEISEFHLDGHDQEMNPPKECEIVYYPKTKALGIQGHPEKLVNDVDFYDGTFTPFEREVNKTLGYCNRLVNSLMTDKL